MKSNVVISIQMLCRSYLPHSLLMELIFPNTCMIFTLLCVISINLL